MATKNEPITMFSSKEVTLADRNVGGFVLEVADKEIVTFTPSIVTSLFMVNKFHDTQVCFLLCKLSKKSRFRSISRCGLTRYINEEDNIVTIDDGRVKKGHFNSAAIITVSYDEKRFADVKVFPQSIHICGLRDLNECLMMLKYVIKYFENLQAQLMNVYSEDATEEVRNEFFESFRSNYPEEKDFNEMVATVDASNICCKVPITIQSTDIVMTNYRGEFNRMINIRVLYHQLQSYPGLICYLSTMSNSNALNIIILESEPFYPVKHVDQLAQEHVFNIKKCKETYLCTSRRTKAQEFIKHSIFIYSSGKFIQSSRKNESSKKIMQEMVLILMKEVMDFHPTKSNDDNDFNDYEESNE